MFNPNPYYQPGMPQGPAFQRPAFQQQPMPQMPMFQQQPIMQDGMIQARFVSCREEAVASNVMPGMECWFVDRANHAAYYKAVDVSGNVDFREYSETQPAQQNAPQYVTVDALDALRVEIDQILDRRFAAFSAPKQASRKAVTSSDE